jgi:signal transduction histidine kinase/ActR/RegA family two-component response regulator
LAIAHRHPAKQLVAEELQRRYPLTMADQYGVANAIRTGQSEVFADISEAKLRAAAGDERQLNLLQQVGFHSAMIVPLMGRGRTLGAISLVASDPQRRFTASDRVFAEELASRAALAVDNAKLYEAERLARAEIEHARQRLMFLTEVTTALTVAFDYEASVQRLTGLVVPRLADCCILDMIGQDGDMQPGVVTHVDAARGQLIRERRQQARPEWLVSRTLNTGESSLYADVTDELLVSRARDERELDTLRALAPRSLISVALVARGRTLGSMLLVSSASARRYTDVELQLAEDVASRAALAIDNARLYEEAQETEHHQAFLSELSRVLAASLDVETTARAVAHLVLPELGDFCLIHVEQEGQLRQLARAHRDLGQEGALDALGELYRHEPADAPGMVGQAWRRGTAASVYTSVADVESVLGDDARIAGLLARLRPHTICCAPLRARGRALGVLTLALSQPGRVYSLLDRQLAEETAHRAAVALDNARLYREAQEASRMKDEFLATLSHELRTPLNAMLGWARLLAGGSLDAETSAKAVDSIERNTLAQAQLVSDILDVSRIITGKLRLNLRPLEVAPVVEAALDAVHAAAGAKNITVQATVDGAPRISADPDRLLQVIWNLLLNAVKFTPRGGRVDVRVGEREGQIEIRVEDSGIGITPEFLPYVFDRFRQADASTSRVHGGLGLGLAIVRHLVELHGGTVTAESDGPDRGARFVVRVPSARAQPGERESAPEPARKEGDTHRRVRRSLQDVRVLVVDDEADSRELVKVSLQHYGATVATAASVAEALALFPAFAPDAVVADVGMPGEDGYSLIQQIRGLPSERGGGVPAIALTAYALREDRERAFEAGFSLHMAKPVEPAELAWTLVSLTRGSRG